ncbi:DUF4783 domain-containing protein [Pedobacter sp. MW01-1-1]|uniref:DUF4783 domain-containing protein n=1 Tax=Pedobacter sp. MW01-1-1 TaxID=3383027 RepID=UPI003FEFCD92
MIRSFFLFVTTLTLLLPTKSYTADIVDDLSTYFRTGNSKEIAKMFASTVEFIILDEEDVYSKAQGEQILKSFFAKNSPLKTTIVHKINNNPNYRFGVILMNTAKHDLRISITLKKFNTAYLITEIKVEEAKN